MFGLRCGNSKASILRDDAVGAFTTPTYSSCNTIQNKPTKRASKKKMSALASDSDFRKILNADDRTAVHEKGSELVSGFVLVVSNRPQSILGYWCVNNIVSWLNPKFHCTPERFLLLLTASEKVHGMQRSRFGFPSSLVAFLGMMLSACASISAPHAANTSNLLADVFSEHAVIQANQSISVWGIAIPGDEILVELGREIGRARTSNDGRWSLELSEMSPGGPYDMSVSVNGEHRQTVRDILIGEVWLCSGQSNMEMPVRLAANGDREIEDANHRNIRLLKVERTDRATPQSELPETAVWAPVTPDTVRDFSAVCYYFGRDLSEEHNVPVGLIDASWGGSIAQAWTSAQSLRAFGGYDEKLDLNQMYASGRAAAEQAWEAYVANWWRRNDSGAIANPVWSAREASKDWSTLSLPQEWENTGIDQLAEFDGVVWFQRDFELTEVQAAQGGVLTLGPIDDWDSTWLNGTLIGETQGWRTHREYSIRHGVLQAGQNTIAVRVLDGGNGGGFRAQPDNIYFQSNSGQKIELAGQWRYAISRDISDMEPVPQIPWRGARGVGTLFNGMIAPLTPYSIQGVLWYQGESDRKWPQLYKRLLPNLMSDWRENFNQAHLPFVIIQLASYGPATQTPEYSAFSEIRNVQRLTALKDPAATLVITIDIGDRFDIHPTNKQEVGRRSLIAADRLIYGAIGDPCDQGPTHAYAESTDVIVAFPANCTLHLLEASDALGFQICMDTDQCRFVSGKLENNLVMLTTANSASAVSVRYCWSDSPICNVTQANNLPLGPFEMPLEPSPQE